MAFFFAGADSLNQHHPNRDGDRGVAGGVGFSRFWRPVVDRRELVTRRFLFRSFPRRGVSLVSCPGRGPGGGGLRSGFPWKIWEGGNAYGGMFVGLPRTVAQRAVRDRWSAFSSVVMRPASTAVLKRDPRDRGFECQRRLGGGRRVAKRRNPGRDAAAPIQFRHHGLMIA